MGKFSKTTNITVSEWVEILRAQVTTTDDMRGILLFMFESKDPPYKAKDIARQLQLGHYSKVTGIVGKFSDKVLYKHLHMVPPDNTDE